MAITSTLAIVLIPLLQLTVRITLESTVKSMLTLLVLLTHVKILVYVLTMDTDLLLIATVLMDGKVLFAQFHQLTIVFPNNVEPLVSVSPQLLKQPTSQDVSVLMDTLELTVLFLLLSALINVKTVVSVFMMLNSPMVILKTLLVSVHHLLLDNGVNGMRPNGTLLHPPKSASFLL
jgi:hypothetical protein